jgi:DNA-binding PadR family transcriptional regulator
MSASAALGVHNSLVLPQISKGEYVTKKLLDFEILYLFAQSSHTGYSLRKALLVEFGNRVSFGTVYPHLRALCNRGMIRPCEVQSEREEALQDLNPLDSKVSHGKRAFVLTTRGAREYSRIENELIRISGLVQQRSPQRKISALIALEA